MITRRIEPKIKPASESIEPHQEQSQWRKPEHTNRHSLTKRKMLTWSMASTSATKRLRRSASRRFEIWPGSAEPAWRRRYVDRLIVWMPHCGWQHVLISNDPQYGSLPNHVHHHPVACSWRFHAQSRSCNRRSWNEPAWIALTSR